jgi:PAS domain S-box-containing protein
MHKEKFYQTILENAFDGVHIIDSQGVILYISPNGARLLGYKPADLIGKNASDFILPADIELVFQSYTQLIRNPQTSLTFEARFFHQSGKILTIETRSYNLLQNPDIEGIVVNFQDITERKFAEHNQQQILQNLKAILDNTQHTFFLINIKGEVLHFNQIAEEMAWLKLGKKLWIGMPFEECLAESRQKQGIDAWQRSREGEVVSYEAEIDYPNGEKYWYEVLYSPIKTQGIVSAIAFSSIDITARKIVQNQLNQSEIRLKAVLNNTIQAFFMIDLDYKMVLFNQQAIEYARQNWQKEIQIGSSIFDFIVPQEHEVFKTNFQRCLNGEVIRLEREIAYPNHSSWFEVIYMPILNHQQLANAVSISLLDISERKIIEQKLRESEKLYRIIAENAPKSSVNILDRELIITFTEGQVYDYLSIKAEDFIGKSINDFFPPHTQETFKVHFARSFAGENQVFEYKNRFGYFLATSVPLPNAVGEIDRILLTFQDVSDLKKNEKELQFLNNQLVIQTEELSQQKDELTEANQKLIEQQNFLAKTMQDLQWLNLQFAERNQELFIKEEELATANEELIAQQEDLRIINEQLLEHQAELEVALQELSDRNFELDQIVYRTSHDIRSPLASVLGLINIMKLEGIPDNLTEYIQRIEASIKKLERFANSMLDFAKVSRTDKRMEVIDFEEVIEKFWDDFRYLPNFEKIERKLEIQNRDAQPFLSDLFRIEIIFRNLISNAIKYANPMREDSFLHISIVIESKIAQIVIKDNGIGIRQEYLDKVFDMFFRATEKSEGTGLGLYIVKQTVEKLNGKIDIQSVFGEGTEIKIQLLSYLKE